MLQGCCAVWRAIRRCKPSPAERKKPMKEDLHGPASNQHLAYDPRLPRLHLSPGRAEVNSQGRKPLERCPRTSSPGRGERALPPLPGLKPFITESRGLRPRLLTVAPSGAGRACLASTLEALGLVPYGIPRTIPGPIRRVSHKGSFCQMRTARPYLGLVGRMSDAVP
jgi:hypothetical protein